MILLKMSFSASIFIIAIMFIRVLALKKLPSVTFSVLWNIVIIKLLFPIKIPTHFSIYNILNWNIGQKATTNIGSINNYFSYFSKIIIFIWASIALFIGVYFVATHLYWKKIYETALPAQNILEEKLGKSDYLISKVQIKILDRISVPLTYGLFHPVVILPVTLLNCEKETINYVLAHEFTHIRKKDVLVKWLLVAGLCIHWFNPLVWIMYIFANRDLEISCDSSVLKQLNESQKTQYALSLISLQEMASQISPLCNGFNKNALEERIKVIMNNKRAKTIKISLSVLVVLSTIIVFGTSASENVQAQKQDYSDNSHTQMNFNDLNSELNVDESIPTFVIRENEETGSFSTSVTDQNGNIIFNNDNIDLPIQDAVEYIFAEVLQTN